MALFSNGRVALLERRLAQVTAERDDLKSRADLADRTLAAAEQELSRLRSEAGSPAGEAAQLRKITSALRSLVPTIAYAPPFGMLAQAKKPEEYAQTLSLLLRHAHAVGVQDGAAS